MCANRAVGVLDWILLDGPILSSSLLSTEVLFTALLIIEGLPNVPPYPVIHKKLSV